MQMKRYFNLNILLLLYYLNPILVVIPQVHSLSPDGLSLLSLKSAISTSSSVFSDWNDSDQLPCHWSGIQCANISSDPQPRVVGLSLAGKHLKGYIPSELGNLIYLRRLNLHDNDFHGSLPKLFNATSLHSIFLYNNNFSGPLPISLCNLPRLQNLDFSKNSFSGSIPHDLRNCKQIQRLILGGNQFNGSIPKGIWSQMTNLIQLDLSSNHFTGAIPEDLGELQSLSGTLNLSFNHLSGEIPKTLGDLPMTVSFDLRHNNLSGEIPQTGSFASQGPTAFLSNPLLCGFPLQKNCNGTSTDPSDSTPSAPNEGSNRKSDDKEEAKGLKSSTIIFISVADAVVVAIVGLIIVYIYWKKLDDSNTCSCTGTRKLGGHNSDHGNGGRFCGCFTVRPSTDSDVDSEKGSGGRGGGASSSCGRASGEGELVAIDKGFSFELDELFRASAYVLGKSGLGIVYKVVLGNGIPVAVRRLGEGGEQRYKEFAAEIQAIGKIKHPNVVKLRAYYWAPDEKLLISDFINNGNLATALRGRGGQPSSNLTWAIRLKIAKGAARGIAYLHECSPRKFVHGDIKPSNILLDNDFNPYISDFGLNRLITITGNSNNTDHSSGGGSGGFMGGALPYIKTIHQEKSNSYRSPEARIPGTGPTQKWDIYSFGVVLFELLTGKNPENPSSFSPSTAASSSSSSAAVETQQDLVRWVRKGFKQENPLSDMVDPMLIQEVHVKKEVLAAFHVALACTEGDPEIRPRMKTVSENLGRIGN